MSTAGGLWLVQALKWLEESGSPLQSSWHGAGDRGTEQEQFGLGSVTWRKLEDEQEPHGEGRVRVPGGRTPGPSTP